MRRHGGWVAIVIAIGATVSGLYNAALGGFAGDLSNYLANAHWASIGSRPSAVIITGLVALVGVGVGALGWSSKWRLLAVVGIVFNVIGFLWIAAFAMWLPTSFGE